MAALVLASILVSLVIFEIGLRAFERFGVKPAAANSGGAFGKAELMRYVLQLPAAPGTDRRWFLQDPPPLPNRSQPSAQRLERYQDFEKRGIFPAQADYIWNKYYLEGEQCSPNHLFDKYPGTAPVFDPPTDSPYPRYRFAPNITTAAGLVTNQFGLRGPPISLGKPSRTIRIAFLGASTTLGFHQFPFSYPERVTDWLNRFAKANGLDVQFEGLNSGREGINSQDIAAILRNELLPLNPDIALYYPDTNQFVPTALVTTPVPPPVAEPNRTATARRVPEVIRNHLALGRLVDRTVLGGGMLVEPSKPAYRIAWPPTVNEKRPDVDSPDLPLNLPTIVGDLDSMRHDLESIGAQFIICSLDLLSYDGLRLSPLKHEHIYNDLNTRLWPLRYGDIRRLTDFQNRVFRYYAASRGIALLDIASVLPQDPDLFSDAIHMTEQGERLKAWIIFQQLEPIIRKRIESGELPRKVDAARLPPPPSLAATEMPAHCPPPPSGRLDRIDHVFTLETIEPGSHGVSIHYGRPVQLQTSMQQWSVAASIPIMAPGRLLLPSYLYLRARVRSGRIGLAVLDNDKAIELQKEVSPSLEMQDIYVPVVFPERAATLAIQNIAAGNVRSEIWIEDAALKAFSRPVVPDAKVVLFPLSQVHTDRHISERGADGLVIETPPGYGAYAAEAKLNLDKRAISVHVWMRVLEETAEVGILSRDGKKFLAQRALWPTAQPIEIILPAPGPGLGDNFIVSNGSLSRLRTKLRLEKIEIHEAP